MTCLESWAQTISSIGVKDVLFQDFEMNSALSIFVFGNFKKIDTVILLNVYFSFKVFVYILSKYIYFLGSNILRNLKLDVIKNFQIINKSLTKFTPCIVFSPGTFHKQTCVRNCCLSINVLSAALYINNLTLSKTKIMRYTCITKRLILQFNLWMTGFYAVKLADIPLAFTRFYQDFKAIMR